MRLCVIGSGYVGLVTGACLASSGNHVTAVDVDAEKVSRLNQGECPIYERGLTELLRANLQAARLRFTTDLADAVRHAQVIFICVGTPGLPYGAADMAAVERVVDQLAPLLQAPAVVVTKSTVPVGTGQRLEQRLRGLTAHSVHVVSNPEFLKEGTAVDDFNRPDRVVIGAEDAAAGELVAELYRPFVRNNKPILIMSRLAAEMTKYASNAYLATRISFINEIADLCGRLGVDVDQVRRGMGLDARIGQHFLYPGLGYGGSCFPKDVRALAWTARQAGVAAEILEAVDRRNQRQRTAMLEAICSRLGAALPGATIAVWGLTFKPNTDDLREAPAITIVQGLLESGARVRVHDPQGLPAARAVLPTERVTFCDDAYHAAEGADALLIATEWMEYRSPDHDLLRRKLCQPLIFDGRNVFDTAAMRRCGFEYYSVGRPAIHPAPRPAAGQTG